MNRTCSWCKGQGTIQRVRPLTELSLFQWFLVLGSSLFIILGSHFIGTTQGSFLVGFIFFVLLGAPLLQLYLWLGGSFGSFMKSVPCPRCGSCEKSE